MACHQSVCVRVCACVHVPRIKRAAYAQAGPQFFLWLLRENVSCLTIALNYSPPRAQFAKQKLPPFDSVSVSALGLYNQISKIPPFSDLKDISVTTVFREQVELDFFQT